MMRLITDDPYILSSTIELTPKRQRGPPQLAAFAVTIGTPNRRLAQPIQRSLMPISSRGEVALALLSRRRPQFDHPPERGCAPRARWRQSGVRLGRTLQRTHQARSWRETVRPQATVSWIDALHRTVVFDHGTFLLQVDEKRRVDYSGSRSSGFSTSSMFTSLNVITRTCLTNRAGRYMSHTQASASRNSK